MSDNGEQSFVSRGVGWWTRLLSVAPLMRHGGCVRSMPGGGWVVWVRCQCESALFPALDARSVSLVTADLPVFTLFPAQQQPPVRLCDHAQLCGTCGGFFSFLFLQKPSIRHTSLVQLFFRFTSSLGGALHLNLTAALCPVLCSQLSVSICRGNISC